MLVCGAILGFRHICVTNQFGIDRYLKPKPTGPSMVCSPKRTNLPITWGEYRSQLGSFKPRITSLGPFASELRRRHVGLLNPTSIWTKSYGEFLPRSCFNLHADAFYSVAFAYRVLAWSASWDYQDPSCPPVIPGNQEFEHITHPIFSLFLFPHQEHASEHVSQTLVSCSSV